MGVGVGGEGAGEGDPPPQAKAAKVLAIAARTALRLKGWPAACGWNGLVMVVEAFIRASFRAWIPEKGRRSRHLMDPGPTRRLNEAARPSSDHHPDSASVPPHGDAR